MLALNLPERDHYRVLCLGAHSDDIEIGCGGSILRLVELYPDISFTWVVLSATGERRNEALGSATSLLQHVLEPNVIVKDFRDGYFPFVGIEVKDYFEELKKEISPDVIFTHRREDLHQDHHVVADLTRNTFRDHLILEYEIPKYDGDLGAPNVFIPLDETTARRKVSHLMAAFASQTKRQWFTEDTFMSLLRLRGIEANSPTGYAEGFYCRKLTLLGSGM